MIVDGNGNIIEERRKANRRKEEKPKLSKENRKEERRKNDPNEEMKVRKAKKNYCSKCINYKRICLCIKLDMYNKKVPVIITEM